MSDNSKVRIGLTTEQVNEKISQGLVNGEINIKTKSYKQIILDNLLSLFNLVNAILLVCILLSGSLKNALFFLIVIWNFVIGSLQEIRAKKTIDKLSIMTTPRAYALRDGRITEIPVKDIVLGEVMRLQAGNRICADAVIIDGRCQVNESLITGESEPVSKGIGDHILSGSFLVSGRVMAEVEHIGSDNYVNKITAGAKHYKKPESVIMKSVNSIVRAIAICIVPLAALVVWNNFFRGSLDFSTAMVKTVAAISSMIPGGLVLLVSIVLAVSVVRLSMHKTLVQDLYCVENLARVDKLLLDKTGTITEGVMKVEQVIGLDGAATEDAIESLKLFSDSIEDENSTITAIRNYLKDGANVDNNHKTVVVNAGAAAASDGTAASNDIGIFSRQPGILSDDAITTIPFSSDRKWSLVAVEGCGSYILGAPEYVLGDKIGQLQDNIQQYTEQGSRVVIFARSNEIIKIAVDGSVPELPSNIMPLMLIVIGDKIRATARDTFAYFRREGVDIKVISGDNPQTASMVAAEAGLNDADKWIDATTLKSDADIADAVDKYTVFGRVTPNQKCQIVKALQKAGHTVAMTGDGANDVLALKEADCSIAMQSGSDAARNVANLVLLDSDFSSLPLVVAEGRKSINNLQRSSALYLTKTTYSFIFSFIFLLVSSLTYPFENIQVTLIGAVTIGLPSFMLAFEPNTRRIQNHFLKNVFIPAIPVGILEAAAIVIASLALKNLAHADMLQLSTAATYLMLLLGICTVFNICGKIDAWKIAIVIIITAVAFGAVLLFPKLFSIVFITEQMIKIILLSAAIFFAIEFIVLRVVIPKISHL